jgi:hypothetical protein
VGPMLRYLPYMLLITLWIYAFADCLGTPRREIRGLPKAAWALVILLFGWILIGPLAWLLVGKRRVATAYPQSAYGQPAYGQRAFGRGEDSADTEDEPPAPPAAWVPPDDNPEFLRSLSELIRQKREDGTTPSEGEQQ